MDKKTTIQIDNLYTEGEQWTQNVGGKNIHAKRLPGKFRILKWLGTLVWLPFFLTPYIDWNGKQAVLFDIEKSQYHLFNITIFSQDLWILASILLFLAIFLASMTTIIGRAFCGYFCFQTVWTDIFTKIEEYFEGSPNKRRVLENSSWNLNKIRIKLSKHIAWIAIALLSGGTWMLYFGVEWVDYINGVASTTTLMITGFISLGAYVFAGFMREQSCLWICPYSRIQGVMLDKKTIIPTYDYHRGEQRGRLVKGEFLDNYGDCIDCNQCVAVCPTGVDIRKGQEYGCITCGLCIDACDSVMTKVGKPLGLIKYTSLDALNNNKPPIYPHKRVLPWFYVVGLTSILLLIFYKMSTISPVDFKVIHDRTPLFIKLSDGSIRNKYQLKIMNKSSRAIIGFVDFKSSETHLNMKNHNARFSIDPGVLKELTIYLFGRNNPKVNKSDVEFIIDTNNGIFKYHSTFISPKEK